MAANNTPCKKRKILDTGPSATVTSLVELNEYVQSELAGAVFDAQADMINRMFPVDQAIVDEIYASLVRDGWYTEQGAPTKGRSRARCGRWKHIPMKIKLERELYPGFVKVANAIAHRCPSPQLSIHWVDSHSKSPKSSVSSTNELKPDLTALVLPRRNAEGRTNLPGPKNKKLPLWWRRVLVALQVKKERHSPAIIQLMTYIRLVFREQADRRFALGFVLALQNLVVHVADRSGVLRSVPINIHKDPKIFIQVMAGLSLLQPHRLGWDPTMKILKNPEAPYDKFVCEYSWETDRLDSPGKERAYDENWVVEMPLRDDDGNERRAEFVLFEALSLQRAGVVRGRGTRIWKAWIMDDMKLPAAKRHVYVYKDTWKDDRRQTEGELFEHVGRREGVAEMVSHEVVHIDGKVDDTLTCARQNVQHRGEPLELRTPPVQKLGTRESYGTPSYIAWDDLLPPTTTNKGSIPRGRTHTRLVIKDFGWPIRRFISLLELIRVLKNVVDGHQNLLDNGVLHRDISQGNIIIVRDLSGNANCSKDDNGKDCGSSPEKHISTKGQLIDLDYAKAVKDKHPITDEARSCTWPFVSYEVISKKAMIRRESENIYNSFIPTHGHQHDLESLFWVLCWLALCRGGPGVHRVLLKSVENSQDEDPEMLKHVDDLRAIFHALFENDGPMMVKDKAMYFNNPGAFYGSILSSFATYFTPIKPLARSLFDTLLQAHVTRGFGNLHADFRRELAEFEKKLENDPHGFSLREAHLSTPASQRVVHEMVEEETERRRLFWGEWDCEMDDNKEKVSDRPDAGVHEQKKRKLSIE